MTGDAEISGDHMNIILIQRWIFLHCEAFPYSDLLSTVLPQDTDSLRLELDLEQSLRFVNLTSEECPFSVYNASAYTTIVHSSRDLHTMTVIPIHVRGKRSTFCR